MACVQQQHLFAGNRVEHAAQLIRRNTLLGFAVGEQERHQPIHGGIPQPVGADVEVADVVRVRIGECFANEGDERGGGGQPVFAGDDGLHVKRAAGKGIRHAQDVIAGGWGGVGLGEEAVAAHEQRAIDAPIRRDFFRVDDENRAAQQHDEQHAHQPLPHADRLPSAHNNRCFHCTTL